MKLEQVNAVIADMTAPGGNPSNVDIFPASFAQQRLWFLSQLEPDSASYNTALAVRLQGLLDQEAAVWSLNEIVRRHEILRTTFDEVDGELMQVIDEDGSMDLPLVDFSSEAATEREVLVAEAARVEAHRPFDLRTGPLMRMRLFKLGSQEHLLVLTLHHIVCDGWSSQILAREFGTLYEARHAGLPSPLSPLPVQYADYAVWQREWLQGAVVEERLAYWKGRLSGKLPVLDLPTDRPRPAIQSDRGARFGFSVSRNVTDRLRALSRSQGATLFMTLVAAFQVCLMRYSGLEDFCIGTPVANRPKRETELLIGFFANTLVLRADLSGNPAFLDLLARVQETVLGAQAYQDLPFEQLVDALQPVRALSHTPLFQVMFTLQTSLARTMAIPSLEVSAMELDAGGAKFDLSLDMTEDEAGLDCAFEYNQDLFDEATVATMAVHLRQLLDSIVDNPQARLSELAMLTKAERRTMLVEWNDTAVSEAVDGQMVRLFEAQAARTPEAVAVACGEETLNYRDLNDRADRIAHALSLAGVGCETVVAVLGDRDIDYVAMMVGLWKCGGVYLPLDPGHPPSRWLSILEASHALVVLTTKAWIRKTHDTIDHLPEVVRPLALTVEACLSEEPRPSGNRTAWPSEKLAYVIYTSGSTGVPKGAMVTEQGLVNHLRSKISTLRLGSNDIIAQTASQGFDISVWQLTAALLCGARTLIVPDDVARDPEQLLSYVDAKHVTVLETVPTLLQGMLDSAASSDSGAPTFARLRWLLPTGEALSPTLIRRWFEHYRHVPLINAYGPAECADDVAMATITTPLDETRTHAPIGKPITNLRGYVVDGCLELVPIGATGELCIAGAGVGRGYLHDPARTAETFVPDPFSGEPGARLYRTGDRVRHRRDGTMEFLGRRDQQVKLRGVRIELGEIEERLQASPDVREAAAVVRQDGPGQKRLVAYVVPCEGASCDADRLIRLLREQLPEPMVPSTIITLEVLPRNVNGKIDRQALPQPGQTGADEWTAPRTSIEAQLAAIWAEVLKVERVGVHDNFFELGGDSILSLQVISRAKAQGLPLTPRHLFQHQTIAELAEAAGGKSQPIESLSEHKTTAPSIDPSVLDAIQHAYPTSEDVYRLTPLQQGLLFHSLYEPRSGVYIEQLSCLLRGHLDHAAFIKAWRMVIARSVPLRTAFIWRELDTPMQVVLPDEAPLMIERDWGDLSETQQHARMQEFLRTDRLTDFDLTRPPLMRLALIRIGDDAHYLIWTHHHIVLDGWCLSIILKDLLDCYAFCQGGPDPGESPSQPYRGYVEWILAQDQGASEQYWRKTLAGITAPTSLPMDHSSDGTQVVGGYGLHRLTIPADRTSVLHAYASRTRITVNTLVQGAWALLLSRYCGEDDVLFGTTVSGRSADIPGIETMLGLFINTLPLRVTVSPDAISESWLRGMLQQNAELRQYEHTSLAQIQSWSPLPRGSQLFDSLLVFDNHPTDRTVDDGCSGLTAHDVHLEGQTNYSLTVNIVPGESLCFFLSYQKQQFSPEQVARIAEHLAVVLEQLITRPGTRLSAIDVMGAKERRQVVEEWNATQVAYPAGESLPQLLEEQAARTPGSVAVVFDGQTMTYRELNERANQLAHHLRNRGVGPEVRIALCMERSLDLIVGLLGIMKARAAYVPLDPTYPRERLAFMLADSQVQMLLTQQPLVADLPSTQVPVLCLDDEWPVIAQASIHNPVLKTSSDLTAYVIYTSGSTGKPKGVMISHRSVVNFLHAMADLFQPSPQDTLVAVTSLSFDIAVLELFLPLLAGGRVVLASRPIAADGARLAMLLTESAATMAQATPITWKMLLETGWAPSQNIRVLCGGEAFPQELARAFLGYHIYPWNLYGPTETTVWSMAHQVHDDRGAVPIGRPIGNTEIYLLNRQGQPVPIGVPGELHIGGVGLARGYWRRPDLTAEKFVPDPFSAVPGRRLYKTGDRARYRPDGCIEFLGRLDHQVKLRGFRIELGEIQARLTEHSDVRDAIVMIREDMPGSPRLVAYVVPRGTAPDAEAVRSFLRETLPDYMIPSVMLFLNDLPQTPNGKVDRKALPAPDLHARVQTYEEPVTESERILADIWAEVLGQPRVGRLDNFFELGGDSINTLQVLARAHQRGVKLTPKQLFEHPTVAAAAAVSVPTGEIAAEETPMKDPKIGGAVDIELSDEDMSNLLEELK